MKSFFFFHDLKCMGHCIRKTYALCLFFNFPEGRVFQNYLELCYLLITYKQTDSQIYTPIAIPEAVILILLFNHSYLVKY